MANVAIEVALSSSWAGRIITPSSLVILVAASIQRPRTPVWICDLLVSVLSLNAPRWLDIIHSTWHKDFEHWFDPQPSLIRRVPHHVCIVIECVYIEYTLYHSCVYCDIHMFHDLRTVYWIVDEYLGCCELAPSENILAASNCILFCQEATWTWRMVPRTFRKFVPHIAARNCFIWFWPDPASDHFIFRCADLILRGVAGMLAGRMLLLWNLLAEDLVDAGHRRECKTGDMPSSDLLSHCHFERPTEIASLHPYYLRCSFVWIFRGRPPTQEVHFCTAKWVHSLPWTKLGYFQTGTG